MAAADANSANATCNAPNAPALVLLCTWTGAEEKHINIYKAKYREIFDGEAEVRVISTSIKDVCFRGSARKQVRLESEVDYILQKTRSGSGSRGTVVVHMFSEGGSNKACELAEAYLKRMHQRLPVAAVYLDSTPGLPRYKRLCKALSNALPPVPLLRPAGLLFGGVVLGATWAFYCGIKGYDNNIISRTRMRLLDPALWDLRALRCYLYSENDALVAWQDVHCHVQESTRAGFSTAAVRFDQSGHVTHARDEKDLYWGSIVNTWNRIPWTNDEIV